jgi:hypothetical protein
MKSRMDVETEANAIKLIGIFRVGVRQLFEHLEESINARRRTTLPLVQMLTMKCASVPFFNFNLLSVANSFSQSNEKKSLASSSLQRGQSDSLQKSSSIGSFSLVNGDEDRRTRMLVK